MGRIRRVLIVLVGLAALVAIAAVTNACIARKTLRDEIAAADRDPVTGIIRGCEPITLRGSGPRACLLVHGWLGSRGEFAGLGRRLQREGFTVRLMRLPGHGTTPEEVEGISESEYRRAVRDEFDALREAHELVDVVGFSMGGALATLLAADEDVHRLVLVAPYFEVTHHWYYGLTLETWTRILRPIVRYVAKDRHPVHLNREGVREGIFSYGVVPLDSALTLFDIGRRAEDESTLGRVRCPVLLVHSRGDESASPEAAARAFERLGSEDKQARWFDRSNHHLLWDHDGDAAVDAIVRFLSVRVSPEGAPPNTRR